MSSDALQSLESERYISLETFRKNGTGVRTPVWFARMQRDGKDTLVVMTNGTSYKVKRLRRNPAVKVAACNMSGKQILGPFHDGQGEVLEDPGSVREAARLLRKKYSWQWRIMEVGAWFGRRQRQWVYLSLDLSGDDE